MPEVNAQTRPTYTRRDLIARWWSRPKAVAVAVAGATSMAATALAQASGFGTREAAHLLRRAGFGGTPQEIEDLAAKGRQGAVDYLVDFEQVSNAAMEDALSALVQDVPRGERAEPGKIDLNTLRGLQTWWTYRMAHTARPLEEKMTLFWHDHFATAISKVNREDYMLGQNRLFREMALANFRDLLVEVSKDPAMIIWLDNNTNIKDAPNENYGRELMELFTMGINHLVSGEPNYTETDIKEVARAFTGWTVRRQGFFFNRAQHDEGAKTVFGQSGNFGGEDIVDLIVERDATAYFMAKKLWEFFAYENPSMDVLDELAEVTFDSGYDVKVLVRHLFNMDAFYGEQALFGQIKSPAEYVASSLRQLGMQFNDARGYGFSVVLMGQMDQQLFNPPTVAGWEGGTSWINTATLLVRYNAANTLSSINEPRIGAGFDANALLEGTDEDPERIVDKLLDQLGPLEVSDQTRMLLIDYLTDGDLANFALDARTVESKVRGLAHLVLSLPEFQLN